MLETNLEKHYYIIAIICNNEVDIKIYKLIQFRQRDHPLRLRYINLSNSEKYREGKEVEKEV